MRLAIDAMGNDRGPRPIVEGVKSFLEQDQQAGVVLVGNQDILHRTLNEVGLSLSDRLSIVHASQVLEMHEKVGTLREKRDCSIMRLVGEVKEGRADAMVALGNTAASVGAACMGLRLLPDVRRAGIAVPMPTRRRGRPCVVIDMGANTVCKARHLIDYGVMASIYAENVLRIENPRVGLLNVGEEAGKGNEVLREAYDGLQDAPIQFVGNAEGGEIFSGDYDVIVCDGFVGNVALKASENLASAMVDMLKEAIGKSVIAQIGAWLARSAFREMKERTSYEVYGGAPLLGVNGICIIGHGRSSPQAVYNALRVAGECVSVKLNSMFHEKLSTLKGHQAPTEEAESTGSASSTQSAAVY